VVGFYLAFYFRSSVSIAFVTNSQQHHHRFHLPFTNAFLLPILLRSQFLIHRPSYSFPPVTMALDSFFRNKIESMKLEIIQGQAVLRRLEAQRNDYNSRVRLLREELGLLQQPGSYVGEVVKVMGTKKVLVKVHPEGKYGIPCSPTPPPAPHPSQKC